MDRITVVVCFFLTRLLAGCFGKECKIPAPDTELSRLKKQILCGYDSASRPQASRSTNTRVYLHMVLRHVILYEAYDTVVVDYGLVMIWEDERLKWEPSDFGNIKRFQIESNSIWMPQIGWITLNIVSQRVYTDDAPCVVNRSGRVKCTSWSSFQTVCKSDLTHWPYDSHVCKALMAPWRLQRKELELIAYALDDSILELYQPNREWAILNAELNRRSETFENSSFDYLEMSLNMARHAATHQSTVVIPALVLVLLTLASSWIEAGSPTRLNLVCTLVVCHILYLQSTTLYLHSNGASCPLILLFYRDSMSVCSLCLIVTLLVRWMSWSAASPPSWMSGIATRVQDSRPGQLLLFLNPRKVGETSSLVVGPNWLLVGRLLDRIIFLVFSVIYLVILIAYYFYYL